MSLVEAVPVGVSRALAVALVVDGPAVLDLADADPWSTEARRTNVTPLSTLLALGRLASSPAGVATAAAYAASRTGDSADDVEAELDRLAAAGVLRPDSEPRHRAPTTASTTTGPVPETPLLLVTPTLVAVDADGFAFVTSTGVVIARADAVQLRIASLFGKPSTVADALATVRGEIVDDLDVDAARHFLSTLIGAGLLQNYDASDPAHLGSHGRLERELREGVASQMRHRHLCSTRYAEHREQEAARAEREGHARTPVVPVDRRGFAAPLALGMLMAYAKTVDDGRLTRHFDFFPRWLGRMEDIDDSRAAIYLFSDYIWSHNGNVEFSAEVKRRSPDSLTVHGGPDAPRNPRDIDRYMGRNPHVDIVVRGEGEHTFIDMLSALEGAVGDGPVDMTRLREVPGLSYRDGAEIVHTIERDRISDMDVISSPYLEGFFDSHVEVGAMGMAIFETNRGCPYSCTYCDWGAATNSRIRKFELERIFAEIEWAAKAEIPFFYLADANFGILARDVEIARKIAEVREKYGFPKRFATNYAKNTVKHLREVIEIITGAGVFTEGLLSLQSMDDQTLDAIHRSNIKVEKYEELATELRRAGLPLFVDLMMGLPGQTLESFRNDVQQCIDREVTGKIFGTEMLVNSPMNDPEYRAEHGIELMREPGPSGEPEGARKHAFVVASATFTRADYLEMNRLRRTYFLAENHGMLRQVSRFIRQRTGLREVDFLSRLNTVAMDQRERYPTLALALRSVPDLLAPPVSWRWFTDEIHDLVCREFGLDDDRALATVLAVQHALLPATDRRFPTVLELDHDYAAWHSAMIEIKEAGHLSDWSGLVPDLATFGPATFTVTDDQQICRLSLGYSVELDTSTSWELTSPVARAMPAVMTSG